MSGVSPLDGRLEIGKYSKNLKKKTFTGETAKQRHARTHARRTAHRPADPTHANHFEV